jgi:phage terminase large subunit-like protein
MTRDYAGIAERYAQDVVAGEILACRYVQLACQRHLDDLAKSKRKDYPYRFDPAVAARVCRIAELLPHTKGKWAITRPGNPKSNLIRLEPWQIFIRCAVFGWLRKSDGKRRFRVAYIEVPRKNGKSQDAATVGLTMLAADGEYGAEVYSGATTEKQAWEVFRPAKLMAERTPDFQEAFGVTVNASNLHVISNGSRFEPIIGKPGDGASPSCAIVDEYHEHEDDGLYDTMLTGMGAREQPLMYVITTAGENTAGPCFALRTDVVNVLEGTLENDELFGVIYTIDEGDDWTSEEALRKANPNYDVSVSGEFLRARQQEAITSARKQGTFKTKHLNLWVTARAAWMNMEAWNRLADESLHPDQFQGEQCFVGLDLSSKIDLSSKVKVFRRNIDGEDHFYALGRHYTPEDRVQEPENRHYQGWVHKGNLTATDGAMIDFEVIEGDIMDDDEAHGIAMLGYDPWGATDLAMRLQAQGVEVVEIPQRVQYLSEPMKWLEGLVLSGRFHHDGDPVLAWAMSNVVVREDAGGNIFPRKDRKENKIDPAVALIMALSLALRGEGDEPESVYEERGVLVF